MTMGIGFIINEYAFLASDKRTTNLNPDGSDGERTDGACKVFPLSERTLVFCGGIVQVTKPLSRKLIREFGRKENLDSIDFERITTLCREQYEAFMSRVDDKLKNSPWLRDFVLSVIVVDNVVKPRLIRFDVEDNFKPIIQTDQGALCVKSAIDPEELWPEIQRIAAKMSGNGNMDPIKFIDAIFSQASKMDGAISYAHDIFQIAPPPAKQGKQGLFFQKITGGTITATIRMTSPIITGGSISVDTDMTIGRKLYIQTSDFTDGIYFDTFSGDSLTVDPGGALKYSSHFWAHGIHDFNGDSGSFGTADGKTVTVNDGIITSIA